MYEFLFTFGMFLLRMYTVIRLFVNGIYERYIKDSQFMLSACEFVYVIRSRLCNYKIEPPYPYYSVSCHDDRFKEILIRVVDPSLDVQLQFDDMFSAFKRSNIDNSRSYILLLKLNKITLTRIYVPGRDMYSISSDKLRKQFLSIEYCHPAMDNKIVIDIDPALYVTGNEILSVGFVERYLAYQNQPYIFDDKYTLEIMDSKIKTLQLNAKQHIRLNRTDYSVVRA